ncbi:Aste57867_21323 [Aphanomyces stellatus]|uniref:Aste57867_21323 protein n=1 Tax=Aphanomyces stellatus TaxID=120398 RepID=A0A485LH65_9STRA|nr:hypothetical protein As57867_021254 [Aphanomyces stellatus]VFT97995.1 Aste57867_21323 [Aphanomyces stellatus]
MTRQSVALLRSDYAHKESAPTTTITFYTSSSSSSNSAISRGRAHLQRRVDAIVQANPWLTGSITSDWLGRLTLDYDSVTPDVILVEASMQPELSHDMDYDALVAMVRPPVGRADTDPLLRMRWIEISKTQAALVVSLSRLAGDSRTHYHLCGMLSADASVRALTPIRLAKFDDVVASQGANGRLRRASSTVGFVINAVRKLVATAPTVTTTLCPLDAEWLAREKAMFTSSQDSLDDDVVASWYFRQTQCDTGVLAVDCRDCLDDVDTISMAGNYEGWIPVQPDDYATPALMRHALTTEALRRVQATDLSSVMTGNGAMFTSLVTLYEPATIPDWTIIAHVPCWSFPAGWTAKDAAILFQHTPSTFGLLIVMQSVPEVPIDPTSPAADGATPPHKPQ